MLNISVVVPTRNRAALLRTALESVRDQEPCGRDLEVLVVDDDCSDETAAVVASFPGFVRMSIKAGTAAGSRNAGVDRATGDWIAFLDDDDAWHPHKLRRCVQEMAWRPAARLIYSYATICDADLTPGDLWKGPNPAAGPGAFYGETLTMSAVLVRRDLFRDIGAFDESVPRAEDQDFCLRAAESHIDIARVEEPLVFYRNRAVADPELLYRSYLDTMRVLRRHRRVAGRSLGWLGRGRACLRVRGWYAGQMLAAAAQERQDAARLRRMAWSISPLHYARLRLGAS